MEILKKHISLFTIILFSFTVLTSGCSKSKSYSELLKEEEQAVNWFLADHRICLEIPENGDFLVGEDAPYYKMDEDGYVYMQVINKGKADARPQKGDVVYFRYKRCNIKDLYAGYDPDWIGNADNVTSGVQNTSLVYGNNALLSTTQFGDGIQLPLDYLGYDSEVNMVIKSTEGFTSDQSQCIPYLYNIKYFKAQY